MGSDRVNIVIYQRLNVSIHAPTWGATSRSMVASLSWCFNPRSHMGSDNRIVHDIASKIVSIHAPTWGATVIGRTEEIPSKFQSTLPHGERRIMAIDGETYTMFQSTLPHGERREHELHSPHSLWFQSTLPHGERPSLQSSIRSLIRFQSTLPHGERPYTLYKSLLQ